MSRRLQPFTSAVLVAALGLVAVGCDSAAAPVPTSTTVPKFLMSGLPVAVGDGSAMVGQAATAASIDPANQIGSKVAGNRVLAIGDSVMASTATRYTNDMCKALVPLGWQVEVEAETGRFIDFGTKVLKRRWAAGWDVVVILLGNNYSGDADAYQSQMQEMVTLMDPRPVVLLTVSEFARSRVTVNRMILDIASRNTNVLVVDWAAITAANRSLTGGDRLHLTLPGRTALAESVASALGRAPVSPGACLDSKYTDDSMGPVQGTTTVPRPTTPATPAADTEVPGT